eukprot:scaffold1305_cov85-Isochrysis_galbana.AAC.1
MRLQGAQESEQHFGVHGGSQKLQMPERHIAAGERYQLSGLAKAHLNGRTCVVREWNDQLARWIVDLDGIEPGVAPKAILPANLLPSAASAAAATPEPVPHAELALSCAVGGGGGIDVASTDDDLQELTPDQFRSNVVRSRGGGAADTRGSGPPLPGAATSLVRQGGVSDAGGSGEAPASLPACRGGESGAWASGGGRGAKRRVAPTPVPPPDDTAEGVGSAGRGEPGVLGSGGAFPARAAAGGDLTPGPGG